MNIALNAISAFGRGRKTETAATRIRVLCPGDPHGYTYLTFLRYTAAATAHALTAMRGQTHAKATVAADAAAVAITVDTAMLDGAGNALAANDLVAIELDNGDWHLGIVDTSGWNGTTKVITLTSGTAIPAGRSVLVGAAVVSYGVAGDANHANFIFTGTASVTTNFPAVANAGPICKGSARNSPIIVDSDNATNAGTIEMVSSVVAKR
jgi:hypothetical protein